MDRSNQKLAELECTNHEASVGTSQNLVLTGNIQVTIDTSREHVEMVDPIILEVDENEVLPDQEDHVHNRAWQLIDDVGNVIHDVVVVAENDGNSELFH